MFFTLHNPSVCLATSCLHHRDSIRLWTLSPTLEQLEGGLDLGAILMKCACCDGPVLRTSL